MKSGNVVEFVSENITVEKHTNGKIKRLEWSMIQGARTLGYIDLDGVEAITCKEITEPKANEGAAAKEVPNDERRCV